MAGKYDYWKKLPAKDPFCCGYDPKTPKGVYFCFQSPMDSDFLKQDWGKFGVTTLKTPLVPRVVGKPVLYSGTRTSTVLYDFPEHTSPQVLFPHYWYVSAKQELAAWLHASTAEQISVLSYPKLVQWTTNVAWLCTSMFLATNIYPIFWSDMVRLASDLKWYPPDDDPYGWDQAFWWATKKKDVQTSGGGGSLVLNADSGDHGCVAGASGVVRVPVQNRALHPFDQISDNFTDLTYGSKCYFAPGDLANPKANQIWFGPESGLHPGLLWKNVDARISGNLSDLTKASSRVWLNGKTAYNTVKMFEHAPWSGVNAWSSAGGNPADSYARADKVDVSGAYKLKQLITRAGLFGGLEYVFASGFSTPGNCTVLDDAPMRGSAAKWRKIAEAVLKVSSYEDMVRAGVLAWKLRNKNSYQLNEVAGAKLSMAREDMKEGVHDWEKKTRRGLIRNALLLTAKMVEAVVRVVVQDDYYGAYKAEKEGQRYSNTYATFKITSVPWDWSRDVDPIFIRIYGVSGRRVNPLDDWKNRLTDSQRASIKKEFEKYAKSSKELDALIDSSTTAMQYLLQNRVETLARHVGFPLWRSQAPTVEAGAKKITNHTATSLIVKPTAKPVASVSGSRALFVLGSAVVFGGGFWWLLRGRK